jgi:molybdopterin-containing oxidoreductase family iron-sulfur binding subunit
MEKRYWKGVEELKNDAEFVRLKNNEFFEELPVDEVLGKKADVTEATPRRDFLKFLGFGVAAASLAACEAPVRKTIPYLVKPENVIPGIPNYYASTFFDGHDYASVVVKTREGRPIKVDGNELSSITKGGASARVQASVLGLYDSERLRGPMAKGAGADWNTINKAIKDKLSALAASQSKIRLVSSTIISPTTKKVIAQFVAKYPTTKHISYDAISQYGLIKAHQLAFGKAALPSYRFNQAEVIVSFGADFLSNWISPIEHSRQYAETRKLNDGKKAMSRHIQFETQLTLTGSNADDRYKLKASQTGAALVNLYNALASKAGASTLNSSKTDFDQALSAVANELWNAKGKSLVVCGTNNVNDQLIVAAINNLLGNYGTTLSIARHSNLRQGNDEEMAELIREMNAGEVGAVIFYNSNPSYTYPDSTAFNAALSKVGLKISFADRADETASQCDYICPDSHYLESWNDAEPMRNAFSLAQPTIQKLFDTRQAQESLLHWCDAPVTDYHEYLEQNWRQGILSTVAGAASIISWEKALQEGVVQSDISEAEPAFNAGNLASAAEAVAMRKPAGLDLVVYEKTGLGNGNQANNPWLQELPDPISKICWDNYFTVSPATAKEKGLVQGNIIEVKSGSVTIKGPVAIQPGQANETITAAVGYGRTHAGKAANNVGFNAYSFIQFAEGSFNTSITGTSLNKTVEADHKLAGTQTHHTMMGRAIVKETTLEEYINNPKAGNEEEKFSSYKGKVSARELDLWATKEHPGFDRPIHAWGMSIDLNSCIGCGACVVACTAENNVPVVGKDEIGRSREMHWIRVDRYYTSDMDKEKAKEEGVGKLSMYGLMEEPAENPQVVFQPVMCQHCNHAPCETVCPVVATTHSSDGLNMMAYNRCVGTRYCANNCPYKVRRFNWFKYSDNAQFDFNMNNDYGKMVLNPDVIVRSRGVMEKCSMCVQRIQYGKLEAKKQGRKIKDGEIKTACAQTCPTNAITFGDYNDKSSTLVKQSSSERMYHLLEELNVQPSVNYLVKVRNTQHSTHGKKEA